MCLSKDLGVLKKIRYKLALVGGTCPFCMKVNVMTEVVANYQTPEDIQNEKETGDPTFTVDYTCECGKNFSTIETLIL